LASTLLNINGRLDPQDPPRSKYDDPTQEYVWAGMYNWVGTIYRPLPTGLDDLERDFPDIYDKMLLDAKVSSSIKTLKLSVLSQGMTVLSSKQGQKADKDAGLAQEVCDFVNRNLDGLVRPFAETMYELLDGLTYGHAIAEMNYEYRKQGPDRGKLCLKAIKNKPARSIAFVVDQFNNVIGLTPTHYQSDLENDPIIARSLLPRKKFVVFSPFTKDGDPRGQSLLRAAYPAWWMKTQAWPEYLRYLAQFASPMLVGYTPANAQPRLVTANGTEYVSSEQAMLNAMLQARNGAAMAFPNGSKIDAISVGNNGQAFLQGSRMFDEQISMAILLQTLATGEGIHQTRASSRVHQDTLVMLTSWVKQSLANTVQYEVIRPLIEYNYNRDIAERLCPVVQIGAVEARDFVAASQAVVNMWMNGYLAESQVDEMDALLGLPPRDTPPVHLNVPGALPGSMPGEGGGAPMLPGASPLGLGLGQPQAGPGLSPPTVPIHQPSTSPAGPVGGPGAPVHTPAASPGSGPLLPPVAGQANPAAGAAQDQLDLEMQALLNRPVPPTTG
jgi:hypothetical protein